MNHGNSSEQYIEKFRKIVREQPDNPAAWSHLGLLLGKAGRTEEARKALERALALDPKNAYIRSRLEVMGKSREELKKSLSNYRFTSPTDTRRINRGITFAGIIVMVILISIPVKLIFFGNTRKLVVNSDNNSFPLWSPRGHYLAYRVNKSGARRFSYRLGGKLYIADSDGSNSRPFRVAGLDPSYQIERFSWSHDEAYVAFEIWSHGIGTVCCCRSDGSDFREIEAGNAPVWSPKGHRLAYRSARKSKQPSGRLVMYDMDDGSRKDLGPATMMQIRWSTDGEWLIFTEKPQNKTSWDALFPDKALERFADFIPYDSGRICKIRVSTGEKIVLTNRPDCKDPIWLPDDDGIVYLVFSRQKIHLYRMDTSGTNRKELYNVTGIIPGDSYMVCDPKGKWIAFEKSFSIPLGKHAKGRIPDRFLGFVTPDDLSNENISNDIFLARTDGSDIHRLKNIHDIKTQPAFSSNGKWLAYCVTPMDDPAQIWKTKVR